MIEETKRESYHFIWFFRTINNISYNFFNCVFLALIFFLFFCNIKSETKCHSNIIFTINKFIYKR
jgi:hypothetical protein